jgi:tryptophan-rich sensory protein
MRYRELFCIFYSTTQVYILCSIYLVFAISSIIFLFLLLDKYNQPTIDSTEKAFSLNLLTVTVKHLRHKYQLLLIPFTLWSGFEQGLNNILVINK